MVGLLSDIGNVRKLNEDYADYYESEKFKFYVVADGMGGHNAGEVASKIAVEATMEYIKNNVNTKEEQMGICLENAVKYANEKIYEKANSSESLSGMGTTITACLIKNNSMVVANVGDSGCFSVTKNGITKITKDHSLVQQLVDTGTITEEEAMTHPNKNIITRALGTSKFVDVDIFNIDLAGTYKFVLSTDGLTNGVTIHEIYDIVLKNDNDEACSKLVELSKVKGSRDNISVIVFGGEDRDDRNYSK
ncbi:Stp1/IreP family PP2C-type Ser/Thr phosphatase [Clostridium neuense]|uniref:Stp1/IreP family PP2C-type Ser/Thr phosphatase n=1 Tax=Clostridium neuense TaxID=1728934 RepID=A0ABW8TBP2_9CLOT